MGKLLSKGGIEKALGDRFPEGEHYFGFENFGNTCYFNSVLQALYFCPSFRQNILACRSESKEEETLLSCLQELFHGIETSKKKVGVVAPRKFFAKLRKDNEVFNSSMQQDAQEFLNYLLNRISELIAEKSKAERGSKTWVHQVFEGTLTNETKCLTCETLTTRDESFLDLAVDVSQNSSITSCLRTFSCMETLCKNEKYFCEKCCCEQEAQKRMRVKALPSILALHLKRFKFVERLRRMKKLSYRVVFPFELRLFNTVDDGDCVDALFDLCAVVVHIGKEPNRGHYISLVKSREYWLRFDDDEVEILAEEDMQSFFGLTDDQNECNRVSESAYILFYQARNPR